MDSPANLRAAEASWLASVIPREKIVHVFSLLHATKHLEDVSQDQREQWYKAAESYYRSSLASSTSSISSGPSIFSLPSRPESLASALTQSTTSSASDPARTYQSFNHQHAPLNACEGKSKGRRESNGRYACPTCGTRFGRSHDMKLHLQKFCESKTRYKCHNCPYIFRREQDAINHCEDEKKKDPSHGLGFGICELPAKAAYGCPHCGTFHASTLEDFHKHVVKHFPKDNTMGPGSRTLRVRALLHQPQVIEVVRVECLQRGLCQDAWLEFEWDDETAESLWNHLEYGHMEEDDEHHALGYTDLSPLIATLVDTRLDNLIDFNIGAADTSMEVPDTAASALFSDAWCVSGSQHYAEPRTRHERHHEQHHQRSIHIEGGSRLDDRKLSLNKVLPPIPSSPVLEHLNDIDTVAGPQQMSSSTAAIRKHHLSYDSHSHPEALARLQQHSFTSNDFGNQRGNTNAFAAEMDATASMQSQNDWPDLDLVNPMLFQDDFYGGGNAPMSGFGLG